MSEIWDTNVNGAVSSGDEADWADDSDSDAEPARRSQKRKRQRGVIRPAAEVSDGEDQNRLTPVEPDEDDDLLGQYMTAAAKKQKQDSLQPRSDSPVLLLDSDDPGDAAAAVAAAAGPSSRSAAGCTKTAAVLSEAGRAAAERERTLLQQLEGYKRAAEEPDEGSDDLEPSQQSPMHKAAAQVEDLTFDLDDLVGSDDEPQAAAIAAAQAGDAAKIRLKFKTDGKDDVTVCLNPAEPLSKAMASFSEYVQQQGWGTVSHFMSPDGDKLTGQETIQGLDLEEGDIIEVYLIKQ